MVSQCRLTLRTLKRYLGAHDLGLSSQDCPHRGRLFGPHLHFARSDFARDRICREARYNVAMKNLTLTLMLTLSTAVLAQPFGGENVHVVAPDGTYLGNLGNRYQNDSIFNPYGPHGSRYSPNSIWNPYGQYGSPYSNQSPWNRYSSQPPLLVQPGGQGIPLTVNPYQLNRLHPAGLYQYRP